MPAFEGTTWLKGAIKRIAEAIFWAVYVGHIPRVRSDVDLVTFLWVASECEREVRGRGPQNLERAMALRGISWVNPSLGSMSKLFSARCFPVSFGGVPQIEMITGRLHDSLKFPQKPRDPQFCPEPW